MPILSQDDLRPQTETVTDTTKLTASLSDINIADVSNLDFICALFHTVSKDALLWGTSFTQPPDKAPNSVWYGGVLTFRKLTGRNNFTSGKANVFYTVSSFFPDEDGNSSRNKSHFAAAHVITVDDVGDGPSAKIPWNRIKLPGSIVIETSPGNCQVVYILLVPITDANLFDRIIDALIHQGLAEKSDPGMKGVTRYARLPVGTNNKTKYDPPHRHVLKEWHPALRYGFDEIIDGYSLDLAPPVPQRKFNSVKIEVEDDPYVSVFSNLGLILTGELRGESGNMLDILCPFHEEHTDRVDEGAAYFIGGGYKCFHGHCVDRTFKDVKEKLRNDHWVDTDELDHELRSLRVGPLVEVLKNV